VLVPQADKVIEYPVEVLGNEAFYSKALYPIFICWQNID
jgi:hypothetical protein